MRLGVVCVLRNEADIAPLFLRHCAALFDHAVLMDHGSTDGTEALVREAARRPGWAAWRVAVPGFHQPEFTRFAVEFLFSTTQVDHVALLDADEFIDLPSRAGLVAALAPLAANPRVAAELVWRNAIPRFLGATLRPGSALRLAAAPSSHRKLILPRALFAATGGRAAPTYGNHGIDPGDGGPVHRHRIGGLLHLPIRSLAQIQQKVLCGSIALRPPTGAPLAAITQWSFLLHRMAEGALSASDLPRLAAHYGDLAAMIAAVDAPCPPMPDGRLAVPFAARLTRRARRPDPLAIIAAALTAGPPAPTAPRLHLHAGVLAAIAPP